MGAVSLASAAWLRSEWFAIAGFVVVLGLAPLLGIPITNLVLRWLGGWPRLRGHYGVSWRTQLIARHRWVSGYVGNMRLDFRLTVGYSDRGMFLDITPLGPVGSAAVLVPWSAIKSRHRHRGGLGLRDVLQIGAGSTTVQIDLPVRVTRDFVGRLPQDSNGR